MKDFKYNRVLILLIILGLMAALAAGWQRHTAEQNNSVVEMVMDYEDIVELAQVEGVPVKPLMQQFKAAGITSLAVYETTLEKLDKSGKVSAVSGAQLLQQYRTGALSDATWRALVERGEVAAEDVYVVGQNPQTFAEVHSDLVRRLSPERVRVVTGTEQPVLAVKANYEKLLKWNLGLPTDEMKEAADQGFYVVARPTNYTKVRAEDVEAVFERLDAASNLSAIMFVGDEVLGYPDQLPLVAEQLKARKLTLHMIEHPLQLQFLKQEGLLPLATALNYQAARVYVIPKDEQIKLKVEEAVQRWAVTDQERNIRVNLLRKYDKPEPGQTLLETNLAYVAKVKASMLDKDFTIGRAGTFAPIFPNQILVSLMILGATAAGVLFLTLVCPFPERYQYILLMIIAAILIFPVLKGAGTLVRQAAALASAIIFPVLAMTYQIDKWRKTPPSRGASLLRIIIDGGKGLIVTVLLSLVGGFYIGALLGDVRFMLEMEIFRGVKLTFVAPLLLITFVYLARYNLFDTNNTDSPKSLWQQLTSVLDYPIYVKTLLAVAVAAIGAWIFIGRSGHTSGVPVPGIELKLRAWLERLMYARPRSKEFMIGHPAFFLMIMALYRQWPRSLHYILVVIATIGQGSLVETFAHIRTPIYMSFIRGLDGMAAGIAVGIIAVIGVQILHYLSFLLGRRTADNE
ncbi:hypothetical protein SDC9_13548 [bioreactor metagenome]|uniref:Uncharacterized protein n=1 Tax=bioreactor metagenome TaxID=1076179 RepID=A0A644TLJ2_9ZZZZ